MLNVSFFDTVCYLLQSNYFFTPQTDISTYFRLKKEKRAIRGDISDKTPSWCGLLKSIPPPWSPN